MILEIDDWKFDVDIAATMEYSAAEAADHCTCAYCRNFYAAVDDTYPQLRRFLAQFGLDIEAPDELIPYEPTECEAYYAVGGRILKQGSGPFVVDGLTLFPQQAQEAMVNTRIGVPFFFLLAGLMHLPWVLSEPMEDVESPANLPSFLKRMWDRLLNRQPKGKFPT